MFDSISYHAKAFQALQRFNQTGQFDSQIRSAERFVLHSAIHTMQVNLIAKGSVVEGNEVTEEQGKFLSLCVKVAASSISSHHAFAQQKPNETTSLLVELAYWFADKCISLQKMVFWLTHLANCKSTKQDTALAMLELAENHIPTEMKQGLVKQKLRDLKAEWTVLA